MMAADGAGLYDGWLPRFVSYAARNVIGLGMKSYLYDEADGRQAPAWARLFAQPKLVCKPLGRQISTPVKGAAFAVPDRCLSAFLYHGDRKSASLPGLYDLDRSRRRSRHAVYRQRRCSMAPTVPDLLNFESTRRSE